VFGAFVLVTILLARFDCIYLCIYLQQAVNEANGLNRLPAALVSEKEEYVFRCYLAQGQYRIISSEIKDKPTKSIGTVICPRIFKSCSSLCVYAFSSLEFSSSAGNQIVVDILVGPFFA
jgi:hypothetical protein